MRRLLIPLAAVALVAVLVIGLTQAGGKETAAAPAPRFDLAAAKERLSRAPAPLARLYRQANALLPGGRPAFAARLRSLRGHPVVVNKWASWCNPCRAEFPTFQTVAARRGTTVAFLGVDGTDKRPAARSFLSRRPLPYPSYEDPSEAIARSIQAPANYPMTVFFDAKGRQAFIHAGPYLDASSLERDIDRYLGA